MKTRMEAVAARKLHQADMVSWASDRDRLRTDDVAGMWSDVYPPATETDLAPGKARITNVKNWLHEALYGCLPDTPAYIQGNKAATEKVKKYRVSSLPLRRCQLEF